MTLIETGQWQHYKGGAYNVIGVGVHSETEEDVVIYSDKGGRMWVRPVTMWNEDVEENGNIVKRFTKIGGKDESI